MTEPSPMNRQHMLRVVLNGAAFGTFGTALMAAALLDWQAGIFYMLAVIALLLARPEQRATA